MSKPLSIEDLKELISKWVGSDRVPKRLRIVTDTTDFFKVDYDDVLILNDKPYLIRNYEKEGRFTIDEQPKFWVRRAIDLIDGNTKVIKMVFHEHFRSKIGDIVFDCVRSPKKEARILELVRGHPNFMQGFSVKDSHGNIVRILDFIYGKTLADLIYELNKNHEEYFYSHFPKLLDEYVELVEAIKFLHDHNEKHGDIRRDHIIKNKDSGKFVWIDFDFNYWHKENMFGYDLFGLGNILAFIVGGGDITTQMLLKEKPSILEKINADDLNIIFNNRIMNLKKVFPYIPESLNTILIHFTPKAVLFYDKIDQLLDDLKEAKNEITR
jgi:serine/threonine protein kinase